MLRIPRTTPCTDLSVLEEIKPSERLSSTVYIRILRFLGHITHKTNDTENCPG